ncbi:nucleotide sugar dehydrogenase [Taibaiella sp. KBW10]|uniref:nucleotide sugar dehydrogenase n=1 Tax=Taibaiella sp. KBW10 TaxID=2153357 RepID=UPI000F5B7CAB|nr:nucleotide sugar dehydrogenase [Taibaiella sp. KBW10]RQO31943.1 nucleotide sugar dehydrogenase [Taibaiella sp. KBW10]
MSIETNSEKTINFLSANPKIAIIGLGYVGLPLACLMAGKYRVTGFDISESRVDALRKGKDSTLEIEAVDLGKVLLADNTHAEKGLYCTDKEQDIADATVYIITVPTPVDNNNQPDLSPVITASNTVAQYLKEGDVVIYESTVYPGLTEEICVPLLEQGSSLIFNSGFFVGYSPERVNPGDKSRTIENILKITSGSTPEIAAYVDQLYRSVIKAGTYKATSIKVAEAAKVIENAQRDINIAFVNELAKICNKLGIATKEVLDAAGTKWNFQAYKPGLAGGHCIGVDPYYLALKAKQVGYYPGLILAARRLNESMAEYIASQIVKCMITKELTIKGARVLMLGITFKENCPDVRNTKIVEVIHELETYGLVVDIFDPWADSEIVASAYNLTSHKELPIEKYDAIVLGVAHQEFLHLNYENLKKDQSIIYDVKSFLPIKVDGAL